MKTALFFIPLFFILTILQTSFLVHFSLAGFILPLVFLVSFAITFFESRSSSAGILGAVIGGVFLDIASSHFFGFWTLILVLLSLAITHIMRIYVRFPLLKI
mgnify:FL=1